MRESVHNAILKTKNVCTVVAASLLLVVGLSGLNQANAMSVFPRNEVVSVATDGAIANDGTFVSKISSDGSTVVFDSNASNLVTGDTNGSTDVFVRDLVSLSLIHI